MDPRQQRQRPAPRPADRDERSNGDVESSTWQASQNGHRSVRKSNKKLIGLVVALVVLLAAYVGWQQFGPTPGVDGSKYQAVFLNNDQVYFGKIRHISGGTLVITNIYYLQQQSNQQSVGQASSNKTDQSNLSLVKLGNELHGPQDEMRINMDQVVFWENLKDNGKVAEAIKNYKP